MAAAPRAIISVLIEHVAIRGERRPLDEAAVERIAESIKEIGLRTPITVRSDEEDDFILVAGRHRLAAMKRLGHERIDAESVEWDETEARLWEIAENLHRSDLTPLQRSEHIDEWRRLIEQKAFTAVNAYPDLSRTSLHNEAGVRKTADALGVSIGAVSNAKKIASITPEAKAEAGDLSRDNLLKVAAVPAEQQVAKVIEIKRASEHPKDSYELSAEWRRSFEKVWNKAPSPADRDWAREWIDRPIMDVRYGAQA